MRRLLFIFAVVTMWCLDASAQIGNATIIPFTGAPSGSCGPLLLALNNSSGALFDCLAGSWNAIGSGSGTVTNVTGTTNQINVANPTTTPVLSLSSTAVLPGTLTVTGATTGPSFTSNGTTAGFIDFPQGSTSAAVAPCNTATSICEQAPTTVTSYLVNKPGTAASGVVSGTNVSSVITQSISGDSNHSKSLTGQTAAITTTALVTSGNITAAGQWTIPWYLESTASCATPGPAVVSLTISFTDDVGARTTTTGTVALGATGATAQNGGVIVLWTASAAAINYSTSYTACTSGTGTYALRLAALQVQ